MHDYNLKGGNAYAKGRLDESFWDEKPEIISYGKFLPAVIHDIKDSASFLSYLESLSSRARSVGTNQISAFLVADGG
mgnify:CR=1 FL=1